MLGYLGRPRPDSRRRRQPRPLSTGDLGRLDADGYLRVTCRIKDIITDERLSGIACAFVVPTGKAPTLEVLNGDPRDERRIAMQKLPERLRIVDQLL